MMPLMQTAAEADAELSQVERLQQAFKASNLRSVACAILKTAMAHGGYVWPDELVLVVKTLAGDDKNVVGTAWRWLGKCKIISRTQERRRSQSKASKGREVTRWKLSAWRTAETFLKRNDSTFKPGQQEFFNEHQHK